VTKRAQDIRVRAVICSRFRIPWDIYPSLTIRERDTLLTLLAEEAEESTSAPKSRPGFERVV
jgi:hypothetical protein